MVSRNAISAIVGRLHWRRERITHWRPGAYPDTPRRHTRIGQFQRLVDLQDCHWRQPVSGNPAEAGQWEGLNRTISEREGAVLVLSFVFSWCILHVGIWCKGVRILSLFWTIRVTRFHITEQLLLSYYSHIIVITQRSFCDQQGQEKVSLLERTESRSHGNVDAKNYKWQLSRGRESTRDSGIFHGIALARSGCSPWRLSRQEFFDAPEDYIRLDAEVLNHTSVRASCLYLCLLFCVYLLLRLLISSNIVN